MHWFGLLVDRQLLHYQLFYIFFLLHFTEQFLILEALRMFFVLLSVISDISLLLPDG